MTRHRSPGRPGRPPPALHRGTPAVHRALVAAVVGGALAAAAPLLATAAGSADPAADSAAALDIDTAFETTADTDTTDTAPDTAGVRRIAAVALVRNVPDPVPPAVDVTRVVKSAGLGEAARRESAARCDTDLDGLGRVKPWARDAARFLSCLHGEPDLIGVAGRARHSDHPAGRAVDFMVSGTRGDRLAACALANRDALGIDYVIWEQRINHGDGWKRMEDRGGATENHFDHVHVSFERRAGEKDPRAARCMTAYVDHLTRS